MRLLKLPQHRAEVLTILNRRPQPGGKEPEQLTLQVREIISRVCREGDLALADFTSRFDGVTLNPGQIKVPLQEITAAREEVPGSFITALSLAKENILAFHNKQLPKDWLDFKSNGVVLGQRYQPVAAVGIYVPGGVAGATPLVSSVLMNALPAVVAGVSRIIMCTPPCGDGRINQYLLAAASECGITEVYKVGGAQAIAAMAYGTSSIVPVDLIVGPGNRYVTEAKRQVYGQVGLDMLAGPSEILIVADQDNSPKFIAADLLSQAEHGPVDEAGAFLVTTDQGLAETVSVEVERQLASLARNGIARESITKNGAIIVTRNLDEAFELANYAAPEHLELLVAEPWNHLNRIKNAGAVFIGPYSTEPIGDYVAGTNHVLPTNGSARYASGLSVDHFIKRTSIIAYNRSGIEKWGPAAISLAEIEGLTGHANAVKVRLEEQPGPKLEKMAGENDA